jgi:hypothetical protein
MWVVEQQATRTVTADAEAVEHNAATRLTARQPGGTSVSGTVLERDTTGVRADDGKQSVRAVALAAALLAMAGALRGTGITGGPPAASSRAPTMPMSEAT